MNKYFIGEEKNANKSSHILKVLKITLFLWSLSILLSHAATSHLRETVPTTEHELTSTREACRETEKETGLFFDFSDNTEEELNERVDIKVENSTENKQVPRVKQLQGSVKTLSGEPLPGVTIVVTGTTTGTVTDYNGNFSLVVPVDAQTITVSFVGMITQEVNVGNRVVFDIVMRESTVGLEEVVIVGFGQQKKITVTGAISQVNSSELVQSPVANISNSLAGRATGIIASQRTGEPGEDQSLIRIRGLSTFSGSQDPLILVDGVETTDYNNIDPNEIENITVLKDASSTAVYGVRGANGVILITTKRGMLGRPRISLSSNVAATAVPMFPERMNAYDYTRLYNEALAYDSYIKGDYQQFFTDEEIELYRNQTDPIFYPDVDWVDMMLKDFSIQHQHNMNIQGGTEFAKYFVSIGMFNQEAQFNHTNLQPDFFDQQTVYNRYNFRSNFDFQVTKRLTAKFNLAAKIEEKRSGPNDDVQELMRSIYRTNPIGSPAIVDGKFVEIDLNKIGKATDPFLIMYNSHRKKYQNYLEGSFRLDYDLGFITNGLRTHATVSMDNYSMQVVSYSKPREQYKAVKTENNETVLLKLWEDAGFSSNSESGKRRQSYAEFGLDYTRSFSDKHNITALLLYNQQKKFNPGYQYSIPMGYQGMVGRVAYDYKNKYLVEINAGYNGNENFAPGKRFGFFPAYSLGWVLSEEPFYPKNEIVSFVKFRGSYGEVGNDRVGGNRFIYLPSAYTYRPTAYTWGEAISTIAKYPGAMEEKIGNPDVTWERAKKLNVGVELLFFKNKLRIIADYFQEKRDNILMIPNTIPNVAGIGSNAASANIGKMDNYGFDGEIGFDDRIHNFHYWVKTNLTYAKNTIVFRDEVENPYPYLMRTGQAYGQPFGYAAEGLYNSWDEVSDAYRPFYIPQNNFVQPGVVKYIDINGDGKIDQFDQAPIGYPFFPEVNYGLSIGGDYKGFDFSFLFQGATRVTFIGNAMHISGWDSWAGAPEYLKESWSLERYKQGLPINFPHLSVGGETSVANLLTSSYFAENASYIRLKNAEIGFRFDGFSFMKNIGVKNLRIYCNGSNLWTWAYAGLEDRFPGVDPEDRPLITMEGNYNRSVYPRIWVMNFGLNLYF